MPLDAGVIQIALEVQDCDRWKRDVAHRVAVAVTEGSGLDVLDLAVQPRFEIEEELSGDEAAAIILLGVTYLLLVGGDNSLDRGQWATVVSNDNLCPTVSSNSEKLEA